MLPNLRLYYIVACLEEAIPLLSCLVLSLTLGSSALQRVTTAVTSTSSPNLAHTLPLHESQISILLWKFLRGGVRRYKYSNLKVCKSTNLRPPAIHMIDCCSCSGIFAPAKQTITTSTSSSSSPSQMSENHSDRSSNTSHLTHRLALTSLITPVQNLHISRLADLVETQTAVPWGLSWQHKLVQAPAITRAAAAAAQSRSEREVEEEAAASSATSLAPAWLCCEATKATFFHSPIQGRRCTAAQIVVKCEPGDGH